MKLTITPVAKNKLYHTFSRVTKSRKGQLISMVFICVIVMNIVLVFSSTEVKPVMIDLTAVLTSGAALFTSGTAILFAYLGKHKLELLPVAVHRFDVLVLCRGYLGIHQTSTRN